MPTIKHDFSKPDERTDSADLAARANRAFERVGSSMSAAATSIKKFNRAASIVMPKHGSTNRKYAAESVHFRKMCEKAGTEPTIRQASKFRNKRGLAFRQHTGELKQKHLEI